MSLLDRMSVWDESWEPRKLTEKEKKYEHLYIFTGQSGDVLTMASMLSLQPLLAVIGIAFVTGKVVNVPLMYLIVDGYHLLNFDKLIQERKQELKERDERGPQELDYEKLRRMIDELDEIDQRCKLREEKRLAEKAAKREARRKKLAKWLPWLRE